MNKKRLFFGLIYLLALGQVFAEPIKIDSSKTEWKESVSDTYVLESDVTIEDRIRVTGQVTLQLNEGCTLTASKGITVNSNDVLIINGTGVLNATGSNRSAGIGGEYLNNTSSLLYAGIIIINGGTVTATGGDEAAGIGGGGGEGSNRNSGYLKEIIINGGTITATGGSDSAGIGGAIAGSLNKCTINGGKVTATGKNGAAGIGGSDGTCWAGGYGWANSIIINGGEVHAKSNGSGCGPPVSACTACGPYCCLPAFLQGGQGKPYGSRRSSGGYSTPGRTGQGEQPQGAHNTGPCDPGLCHICHNDGFPAGPCYC